MIEQRKMNAFLFAVGIALLIASSARGEVNRTEFARNAFQGTCESYTSGIYNVYARGRQAGMGIAIDEMIGEVRCAGILTAAHVIEGVTQVDVYNRGGDKFTAQIVAKDTVHDVALLRISNLGTRELTYIDIDEDAHASIGQWAIIAGHENDPLSAGIVGAVDRNFDDIRALPEDLGQLRLYYHGLRDLEIPRSFVKVFQHDANMSDRWLGSPVLAFSGSRGRRTSKIVGINVFRVARGTACAVAISEIYSSLATLAGGEDVRSENRARLGVQVRDLTPAERDSLFEIGLDGGVRVVDVTASSPARPLGGSDGLMVGDTVLTVVQEDLVDDTGREFDFRKDVFSVGGLVDTLRRKIVLGKPVRLRVLRGSSIVTLPEFMPLTG
ncbi:MAG: S1C family serine protease [Planctomycetes bacterium]|nr:S1C family serine protease [Planctomycetota bacterium]